MKKLNLLALAAVLFFGAFAAAQTEQEPLETILACSRCR